MALETPSGVSIVNTGALKENFPELLFLNDGVLMDYRGFELEIRPHNFIYVRDDVNSVSFTIRKGPIKENGVNGCQVTDMIEVAKMIIEGLNEKYPCKENARTIEALRDALMWQDKRTADRENRNVEGTSAE